jgi:hypothetical protein
MSKKQSNELPISAKGKDGFPERCVAVRIFGIDLCPGLKKYLRDVGMPLLAGKVEWRHQRFVRSGDIPLAGN